MMMSSKLITFMALILIILLVVSTLAGFIVREFDVGIGFWETFFNPIDKTHEAFKLWVNRGIDDLFYRVER